MKMLRPLPRALTYGVIVAFSLLTVLGFWAIRRDLHNLESMNENYYVLTASQMERELLRFELSVADLHIKQTDEALENVRMRFDFLWNRAFLLAEGQVGEMLRQYDQRAGTMAALCDYLVSLDPVLTSLKSTDTAVVEEIHREITKFQAMVRTYALRVIRADIQQAAEARNRLRVSAQVTAVISIGAILAGLIVIVLMVRETHRQRHLADVSRRIADDAEGSSRAKSRFLSMVSHELRNPLNGVLGPLALLSQSGMATTQTRLVRQAQQSGHAIVQMLTSLLDYAELHDDNFQLDATPFRPDALAEAIRASLPSAQMARIALWVSPDMPDQIEGDLDRLRQVFINLAEVVAESRDPADIAIEFGHDGRNLVGDIVFDAAGPALGLRLAEANDSRDADVDQVTSEAVRPLLARGLILAAGGTLGLVERREGTRALRIVIPAKPLQNRKIRVHLASHSTALCAIYRATLRGDDVVFVTNPSDPVDVVLVDATTIEEEIFTKSSRERFPGALFVSLGVPSCPEIFDHILDTPKDFKNLRNDIFSRVAS